MRNLLEFPKFCVLGARAQKTLNLKITLKHLSRNVCIQRYSNWERMRTYIFQNSALLGFLRINAPFQYFCLFSGFLLQNGKWQLSRFRPKRTPKNHYVLKDLAHFSEGMHFPCFLHFTRKCLFHRKCRFSAKIFFAFLKKTFRKISILREC